jgi:hypothetical protein
MKDSEFYCIECKAPVEPRADSIVKNYRSKIERFAEKAPCPFCGTMMFRLKKE